MFHIYDYTTLLPNESSSGEFRQTHHREVKEDTRRERTHQSGNARIDDNFDDIFDFQARKCGQFCEMRNFHHFIAW